MKPPDSIFVGEFITGGGLAGVALPAGLAAEGELMQRAVVDDLLALGDVRVVAARDARLPPLPGAVETTPVGGDYEAAWGRCIDMTEAAWIVAPETGGVLERTNRLVRDRGRRLLGCDPCAVAVAASKLATSRTLAEAGIAVPPSVACGETPPQSAHGWVVKPDDGAGSEDTHYFASRRELDRWEAPPRRCIVQPYIPGRALSLTVLCAGPGARLVACNGQIVQRHGGQLLQSGVVVNGAAERLPEMQALAETIVHALPGLHGYVGVDLIDTDNGPVVLEINPRLTTAYAGLSRSLGVNAAALMLDVLDGAEEALHRPLGRKAVRVEAH